LIPEAFARLVGLGLEIGFAFIFAKLQDDEFSGWQTAHPEIKPTSGWRAIGWAFLGTFLYLVVIIIDVVILSLLGVPIR
jgi:uncharacterized membrane protein